MSAVAGLVVVIVAACEVRSPLPSCPTTGICRAHSPPPPPQYGATYPPPTYAPPNASVAQAPVSQPICTQVQAAEIVSTQCTLAGGNDPCVVYWRSIQVQRHPEAFELECTGLKAYPDPQPPGHPTPLAECDRQYRQDQQRMGIPVRGVNEEQKATYRATWGQ